MVIYLCKCAKYESTCQYFTNPKPCYFLMNFCNALRSDSGGI